MKISFQRTIVALAVIAALAVVGCGGVSGDTYQSAGGILQIQFQSGGKATMSMGGQSAPCTYVEDSKSVTLTCQGGAGTLALTKTDSKTLTPPPGNFIGPLTKK
ncbi:MAG TPA: hypothetical protein VLV89_11670 [Candidatus Acidoferrum sp.]|nr:hypothetical protein [Candidatus Acidoferrum sp.]